MSYLFETDNTTFTQALFTSGVLVQYMDESDKTDNYGRIVGSTLTADGTDMPGKMRITVMYRIERVDYETGETLESDIQISSGQIIRNI